MATPNHPGLNFLHPDLPSLEPDNPPPSESSQDNPPSAPDGPTPSPEKRWSGKYATPEELEAAYNNSFAELERIREESRRDIAAERARIDALLVNSQQRQQPAEDPYLKFNDYGIDPNLMRETIRAEAQKIAASEVQRAMAPMQEGFRARNEIENSYPGFVRAEKSVAEFIRRDPSLTEKFTRLYSGDQAAAMEWAFLKYQQANPGATARESAADNPLTGAAPPSGGASSPSRADTSGQSRAEALDKAQRYYTVSKDPTPYLRTRLKDVIPDSHFKEG